MSSCIIHEQYDGSAATVVEKKGKLMAKQKVFERWEQKSLHGKYVACSKQADYESLN